MVKGKTSNDKKYISVVLVPHSSSKVRTFRISKVFVKAASFLVIFLASIVYLAVFTSNVISENHSLKETLSELKAVNIEQKNLLDEKVDQIDSLKKREIETSEKIKDFMDKYKEITDKYLKTGPEASRSGRTIDRNEKTFATDVSELKDILSNINDMSVAHDNDLSALAETEAKLKEYMDSIPTLWPVKGRISSNFGYRKDPFKLTRTYHEGLDIAVPYGTAIKSAGSGKVTFSGYMNGYGRVVFVNHGHGITTVYGHNSSLVVKEGQKVEKGTIIAKAGSTGRSTGPHLHFEIRVNGSPVDPLKYLDAG